MYTDPEYNSPIHEYSVPGEPMRPTEVQTKAEEFNSDTSEFDAAVVEASKERRKNTHTRTVLLQTAAAITAIIVAKNSFSIDLLGSDIFNSGSSGQGGSGNNSNNSSETVIPTQKDIIAFEIYATYVPTGQIYHGSSKDDSCITEAKEWVQDMGGDPNAMVQLKTEYVLEEAPDKYRYIVWYEADAAGGVPVEEDLLVEMHIKDLASGASYQAEGRGVDAIRTWAAENGVDPEKIDLVSSEKVLNSLTGQYYYVNYYEIRAPESGERPDDAFPELTNLEPNGYVPGYGVLDEDYIILAHYDSGAAQWVRQIVCGGRKMQDEPDEQALAAMGIRYDSQSNTLYLENCRQPDKCLWINLMGNGFKIHASGENEIAYIICYGFYYGGSITFTGDGSLTINKSLLSDDGIAFNSENSQTCMMVDRDITLDIYGKQAAVAVYITTMPQSIYYLSPQKLSGGTRAYGNMDADNYYGTIVDDAGETSTHVTFGR